MKQIVNSTVFINAVKQYSRKIWLHLHQIVYVLAVILFSAKVMGENPKFYPNEYWGTVVPVAVVMGGLFAAFVVIAVQIRLSLDNNNQALVGRVYVTAGLITVMLMAGFAEARTAGVGWMVYGLFGVIALMADTAVHSFIKWAKVRQSEDLPILRFWIAG